MSGDDMVERVARAIRPDLWSADADGKIRAGNASIVGQRARAIQQARAAIEAMREPTEAMVDAGCGLMGEIGRAHV